MGGGGVITGDAKKKWQKGSTRERIIFGFLRCLGLAELRKKEWTQGLVGAVPRKSKKSKYVTVVVKVTEPQIFTVHLLCFIQRPGETLHQVNSVLYMVKTENTIFNTGYVKKRNFLVQFKRNFEAREVSKVRARYIIDLSLLDYDEFS
ncbi:hypothetical protein VNO77_17536 [Canavalia gladiata]|uniref:Uncharacterized protein n=1 Tax=Canavalia gladiata TaxID=3824 RepID=A0AAN9QGQ1_CANGL